MVDESHALFGVTVPLVTVLDAKGRPDTEGAEGLLEAMAATGVHSLMLLGSNGEGALLPADLTTGYLVELAEHWRALRAGGRVIVNVSAPGTTEMLRRAEAALESRPDALVVSPPGYFHHRPDEIEAHLRAIERFGHPYAIYNIPKYANPLPAEVFEALLDSPLLIGMKDSSGDPARFGEFLEVAARREGVAVSQGDERRLLAGLRAGAVGIVPGIGNLSPALAVALVEGQLAGAPGAAAAEEAQETIVALTGVHAIRPGVPTVKAILHDRGVIPTPLPAPPLARVTDDELERLRGFLAPYEGHLLGKPHG